MDKRLIKLENLPFYQNYLGSDKPTHRICEDTKLANSVCMKVGNIHQFSKQTTEMTVLLRIFCQQVYACSISSVHNQWVTNANSLV